MNLLLKYVGGFIGYNKNNSSLLFGSIKSKTLFCDGWTSETFVTSSWMKWWRSVERTCGLSMKCLYCFCIHTQPQALEYLFKFIIQSRILYSRATCGMEEEQFRTSVQELFQSIRFVLSLDSRNSETLIFTQVRKNTQIRRSSRFTLHL